MSRVLIAQNQTAQELRLLKFYIDGLHHDKSYNCLKINGFLGAISEYAARPTAGVNKFLADIDQVAKEKKHRKGSKERKAIEKLKKDWRGESEAIQKCIDCYEHWIKCEQNKDFFTLSCSKPHLLVFVPEPKNEGARMWAAKVLSVNNDRTVTITCFGDHLRADYKFDDCFLYSEAQEKEYKQMNVIHVKNKKIRMQEEYKRNFMEVQMYIENIKKKFDAFVPAMDKVTISDVNQHLIDMYPGAFAQNPIPAETAEPQAEEVNSTDAGPSKGYLNNKTAAERMMRGYRGNKTAAERMMREASQGYVSQGTSIHGSDHLDDDSDDDSDGDYFDKHPSSAPIQLPPIELKIEQVEENFTQHDTESNDESLVDNGDSVTDEQIIGNDIQTGNSPKQNRKRKACENQPNLMAKKVFRGFEIGHSSTENDEVIMVESDDQDETDSARNPDEQGNNAGHFDAMLDEFREIAKVISKYEEKLKWLKAQEALIKTKLNQQKSDLNKSFDGILDEFRQNAVKISKCEEKLKQLNREEAIIRAKFNHSKK